MENFIAARERSKIDQQSLTHMIFGSKEKYERFLLKKRRGRKFLLCKIFY